MLTPEELKPDAAKRPADLPEIQDLMSKKLDTLQQKTDALCALAKTVAKCKRCTELASTRTQTVFGVGDPNATIMFIGEAPGADEDAQGEPFVGRAGQLMNKIIEASQLKREEIYICNILRCRPPGNRNPPQTVEHNHRFHQRADPYQASIRSQSSRPQLKASKETAPTQQTKATQTAPSS